MIIRPSVLEAAENRKPREVGSTTSTPPKPTAGSEVSGPGLIKRAENLALGGAKPSTTELERLLGTNDLVDEFYLQRALAAATPIMRITLRDAAGRERGWATGFMISPRLLLSNWHVFPDQEETVNAIAEANYVLDIAGNPAPSFRFAIRGDLFYVADPHLDFSLVAVDQIAQDGKTPLSRFGYHRLIAEPNKIREGESMTLIQHPGGERRQFAVRENQLSKILDQFLWYQSDTAPGSSGAPAFNDSFQVVALHHSGAARRDENDPLLYVLRDGTKVASLEGIDDNRVDWVANEGLRISVLCTALHNLLPTNNPFANELFQAMQGGDVMSTSLRGGLPSGSEIVSPAPVVNGGMLTIPLQLQISLSLGGSVVVPQGTGGTVITAAPSAAPVLPVGVEKFVSPFVERPYDNRTGYDANFLGVLAPLPTITDPLRVAKMEDGSSVIPYQHFSVVLNKQRRLPLFTAANLDFSKAKKEPEPGRDYSRRGLTGLGENDREKWFTDPRIPEQNQLPDDFYNKDGGQFDKGHVVMRDAMSWGSSYAEVQRANGDTYHVTNCTPQIAGFNQSARGVDNWGDLENNINKQAKIEKLCVLAGPILSDDDRLFEGKDDHGPVQIRIPSKFWKIVLANENGHLAAFAFILEQKLTGVPEEFQVAPNWKPFLRRVADVEALLSGFTLPPEIRAADRSEVAVGPELALAIGAGVHPSLHNDG